MADEGPIRVSIADAYDVAAILALSEAHLGKDYLTPGRVILSVHGSDDLLEVVRDPSRRTVGFCLSHLMGSADEAASMIGLEETPEELGSGLVGVVSTAAVDPEYRRRGILTTLVTSAVTRLSRQASVVCSPLWVHPDGGCPAASAMTAAGMVKVAEYPDHWRAGTLAGRYECPECSPHPCHCTMALYAAEVSRRR